MHTSTKQTPVAMCVQKSIMVLPFLCRLHQQERLCCFLATGRNMKCRGARWCSVVLTLLTPSQQGQTMDRSVNTDQVKSIKSMGQHHMSCSCGDNWDLPSSDHIKIFWAFEYLKCIVYVLSNSWITVLLYFICPPDIKMSQVSAWTHRNYVNNSHLNHYNNKYHKWQYFILLPFVSS